MQLQQRVSKMSDLERIAELNKRLDEVSREGEHIRRRISEISGRAPYWPERRAPERLHERGGLTPRRRADD